jgi:hypothetical protein
MHVPYFYYSFIFIFFYVWQPLFMPLTFFSSIILYLRLAVRVHVLYFYLFKFFTCVWLPVFIVGIKPCVLGHVLESAIV